MNFSPFLIFSIFLGGHRSLWIDAEFYPSFIWHHSRDSLDHFHGGSDSVRSNSLSKSACHPSSFVDSEPASDYHIMSTNEEASRCKLDAIKLGY